MMKKIISVTLILNILLAQFVLPQHVCAWWWSSEVETKTEAPRYDESKTRKDTPQDFNNFLEACTVEERIQMLQALKDLSSLKDKYFGQLEGLPSLEHFTTRKNEVTSDKFLKPSTFNEVLPKTVLSAVKAGIIDTEAISVSAIRKALVWRAYNKTTYYFRDDKEVDYHAIVQWAAKKSGINSEQVSNLSTFALEGRIIEKYFEAMWDKLNHVQRMAVLQQIEKETGVNLDKKAIATMGGTGISEPLFIDSLVIIQTAAGCLGFTFTAGEVGSPEKETVSTFIMMVDMIKTKRWGK